MDGYYDPYPLISLDRPLVIAGYLGAETRQIGYQLAALTGLGVSDLDRKIEHDVGTSIRQLIWGEGEELYRRLERRWLSQLLSATPTGIITLGDGALIDPGNLQRARDGSQLVGLDLDLASCYWRYRSGPFRQQDEWHPLYSGRLEHLDQVRSFHELRQPGIARAHHHIDLRGQRRRDVVDRLMELIDQR